MTEKLTKDEDEQLIWGFNVVCATTNSRFSGIKEDKDGNITKIEEYIEGKLIEANDK